MTVSCEQLAAFVDGELPSEEAEAFQAHLADCAECQAALEDQVQASLLVQAAADARSASGSGLKPVPGTTASRTGPVSDAGTRAPSARPRARSAWDRRRVAGFAAAAAAVVLAVLAVGRPWRSSETERALPFALAAARPLEGRLSHPGLAGYRGLGTMRGGSDGRPELDLKALTALEAKGDLHGVATAWLAAGDFERAERILERLPASPAVMGDLSLAALGRAQPERALTLLERGLETAPDDTRLHWNRGLALQALSLELAAAAEFSLVAQAKEPGWSTEALERADGLRKGALARRDSWKAMNAAGMTLALDGTPYPASMARRNPDLARLYLYHALRAAPTVERVKALAPLAELLDDVTRTKTASAYVARVAAADFHKRGPLANTYREVLAGMRTLEGAEADAFLARLRRSGERDLLLGAILLLHQEDRFVDELTPLVRQSDEPAWYDAPLARGRAQAAQARGDMRTAETSLKDGLASCRSAGFQYRCVDLQRHLAALYNRLDRRKEAEVLARSALEEAFRTDSWFQEEMLLSDLVTSARLSHAPALARAYLDEYVQHDPQDCARRSEYHHARALLFVEALDAKRARREVQDALACPTAPMLLEVAVAGDLLRMEGSTVPGRELDRVRERIRVLREDPSLTAGERLLVDHIEGRLVIERDREAGQRILRGVITGSALLRSTDIEARKAWAHSHHVLAMDAGRAKEWGPAVDLLAEEVDRAAPTSCLLALAGQDERLLFVARGPTGASNGLYLNALRRPLREQVPAVPESLLQLLSGCDAVRVLAEPILQGRPGVLPGDRAWSYLAPGGHRVDAPAAAPAPKRLVVSDVEPPATLGLPRLMPWKGVTGPGDVHLRGRAATPEAVLAEMKDATEVELHTHGLSGAVSDAAFLALSPDAAGRYALTAEDLEGHTLQGAPVVMLAACDANVGAWRYHAVWSLPSALIQAGARAVVAPSTEVPDVEAGAFFQALLEAVRRGSPPAQALRDTRARWLHQGSARWIQDLVAFE
ncbi:CHAT domain-containing protein [Corallococcus aberystwythensis]|uniref:CHAT domain-containing protein n=1 Tax=Corallococcus aberystwythensis TaxID=2316722 RepID=A0A3A8R6F0_9BACT|nr:CHAT domain-containing protein [Corallococcus aberystwythensis]RKH74750.1 CHAT domain-containing protein [Corallococcus aberystwythensis]